MNNLNCSQDKVCGPNCRKHNFVKLEENYLLLSVNLNFHPQRRNVNDVTI